MTRRLFGELELTIINIVKSKGTATVREVLETIGTKNSYTTIMTVMSRLVKKGELNREKVEQSYVYWIADPQPSKAHNLLKQMKNRIFDGNSFNMISFLIESEDLSSEDLKKMETMISKAIKEKHKPL